MSRCGSISEVGCNNEQVCNRLLHVSRLTPAEICKTRELFCDSLHTGRDMEQCRVTCAQQNNMD